MKDVLKEIDMILDVTGVVSGNIDLYIKVVDNASYQRAKKYYKFFGDSSFQKPVLGLYPVSMIPEYVNDALKSLKLTINVTEDYEKGGE